MPATRRRGWRAAFLGSLNLQLVVPYSKHRQQHCGGTPQLCYLLTTSMLPLSTHFRCLQAGSYALNAAKGKKERVGRLMQASHSDCGSRPACVSPMLLLRLEHCAPAPAGTCAGQRTSRLALWGVRMPRGT